MVSAEHYSHLERFLHYVAFSIPFLPRALGELEDEVFAAATKNIDTCPEVFICGLPRSGSTMLLELLFATGEFGSFTYRQMPFLTIPLFWNRLTKPFFKEGSATERAHGDGVQITPNSPESFEEALWLSFFKKEIVGNDCLHPFPPEALTDRFRESFLSTIQRLLYLQQSTSHQRLRYLSKNNNNCSRLPALRTLFPKALFLIPFRHPLTQAESLAHQHKRFTEVAKLDPFISRYFHWLGHYEFGPGMKPIDFDGTLSSETTPEPGSSEFWLWYWQKAYQHILENACQNTVFIEFEAMVTNPKRSLEKLAAFAGCHSSARLTTCASLVRKATFPSEAPMHKLPEGLARLYKEIRERSKQAEELVAVQPETMRARCTEQSKLKQRTLREKQNRKDQSIYGESLE